MPRDNIATLQAHLDWDEDDDDDEEFDLSQRRTCISVMFAIAVRARQQRMQRCRDAQNYLTRPSLPPSPRSQSAWAFLYNSRIDKSFIVTMGVDVTTFQKEQDHEVQSSKKKKK
jgi:hypothetical protein